MLRSPPVALVASDQCSERHHTPKRFVSATNSTNPNSEISSPRIQFEAQQFGTQFGTQFGIQCGIQSYPAVVCEAGGSKLASSCKSFGQGGGRVLGAALGQGEKLSAAVVRSVEALSFWLERGFGGGNGSGSGSNGDGGGDGGGFSGDSNVDSVVEFREEEDDELSLDESGVCEERLSPLGSLDARKEYLCYEIRVVNVEGMELEDDFAPYQILGFTPGTRLTKSDITVAKAKLMATGWYKTVTIHWVATSEDAIKLVVLTETAIYPNLSSFQCINGVQLRGNQCLLPKSIQRDIATMLQRKEKATKQTLSDIQNRVESWYHNEGYVFAKVKGFRTSELTGVLECHVDEGMISRISVSCEDEAGQPTVCYTNNEIISESLPKAVSELFDSHFLIDMVHWCQCFELGFAKGDVILLLVKKGRTAGLQVREGLQWNSGAGKAALKSVEQLGLFDKVNLELAASDSDCGDREAGIAMHLRLKESPRQSADVNTEWSFLCNDAGRPNLRTLQPGGSLCVQHRNISGLNRTVSGTVTSSNILRPEDDLRFKLEYVHPLLNVRPRLEGFKNLHYHTLRLLAFNKRKLSATYYDADHFKEVPAIWIDRAGIKASVIEKLSEQSKLAYGVVVEEVATRDDVGTICKRRGSNGSCGIEHLAFLQMKITRSNLKSGETGLIGARDIFQVDQGVGLGTRAPMFNRHQLAMTRYMPLRRETPEDQLPSVVVLHARYGGCLGDVVNYRSFSNGGPYALRGNNIGELASFSRFIEVAGEVRFPVPQQMEGYCFVDSLTGLQNFGAIWNKPSRLVERIGRGLMYGAGIKMGNVRMEYVIECNDQTGSLKVYTGERY